VGLGAAPAALLLFYHGLSVPAVVAFGDGGALGERFAAALPLLPPAGFVHAFAEDLALLEHVRRVERHGAMRRMLWTGFPGAVVPPEAAGARRLSAADLPQLTSLYAESYPESYFEPVQLERGLFFGVDAEGELASVAGVHVYSEAEGVAMLGNIATRPARRGQGLARAATAALLAALAPRMRHIGLNVRADNAPALRLYERLGFRTEFIYEEARFGPPA
jgi:RimJ/RimL family protein N-acetyltransferase